MAVVHRLPGCVRDVTKKKYGYYDTFLSRIHFTMTIRFNKEHNITTVSPFNTEVSGMKGVEVDWVVVYVTWCTDTLAKATTVGTV
jgi:hypothetical protein